jgi:protein O-GlcNAc transferase
MRTSEAEKGPAAAIFGSGRGAMSRVFRLSSLMPFYALSGVLTTLLMGLLVTIPPVANAQATEHPAAVGERSAADKAFHAGYAAVQGNDLGAAEADFAEVVRLSPEVAAGHAAYGSVLLSLGKLPQATHELEVAHAGDPEESSATLNLARAYEQAGHNEKALNLFETTAQYSAGLTPEGWYAYAQLLLAGNDLQKARAIMAVATEAYPRDALLQDTLGVVMAKQQDYATAEEHFRQAVELDPAMAEPHFHLGTALLLEKQPAQAIAELKTAAGLRPGDAAIGLALGRALTGEGQDAAAVGALQQALKVVDASAPRDTALDIKYALAVALQNTGRNQEALPLFEEAAAERPADAATLTNLGLALVQLGKAKEALPYYDKALALQPNDWILQQDVGVAYLQQSDLNHAIEHFLTALTIDPQNAQLHYDLGLAYKLKDSFPEAIAAFTQAETEDAALADTPYTLGVLYMQTGRFADAQTELKKATALKPDNGDGWSVLGSVDKSLNEPEQAIRDLQRAIQLQPGQPGNHITLAAIYAQQGRHEDAVAERKVAADLSRAAVNKQKSLFALDSGRTLLKQGHVDDAMKQLASAIASDPENAEAHLALADALAAQGKPADAAVERQRAATLGKH